MRFLVSRVVLYVCVRALLVVGFREAEQWPSSIHSFKDAETSTSLLVVEVRSGDAVRRSKRVSPTICRFSNDDDPSAGSPTETLLRLLLPLNDQV